MAPPFVRGPHPRGHHHLTNNNNNPPHPRSPPQSLHSSSSSSARQGRQIAVLAVLAVLGCVVMPQHMCDAWRDGGVLNTTLYSIPNAIKKADFGQSSWTATYVVANIGDMDSDSVDDLAFSNLGTVVVVSWSAATAGVKRYGAIARPAAWAAAGTEYGTGLSPLRYDYNGDGANDLLVSASAGANTNSFANGRLLICSVLPSGNTVFNIAVLKAYTPTEWCTGLGCNMAYTQFGYHVLSYQRYGRFCVTVPSGHDNEYSQWPTQCGITSTVPLAASTGAGFTDSYMEQPGDNFQWRFGTRNHIIVLGDANDDGNEELLKLVYQQGNARATIMFEDKNNWDLTHWMFAGGSNLGAPGDVNGDGVPDYAVVVDTDSLRSDTDIFFVHVYCKYDPKGANMGQHWVCGQSSVFVEGYESITPGAPVVTFPDSIAQGAITFSRRQPVTSLVMWYTPKDANGALTRLDLGRGVGWNTDTPDCKYHSYLDVNPWTQWNAFTVDPIYMFGIAGKVEGRVGSVGGISLMDGGSVSRVAPDPSGRGPKFPAILVVDGDDTYFEGRLVWGVSAIGNVACAGTIPFGGIESSTSVGATSTCNVDGFLKSTAGPSSISDNGATSWDLMETTKATKLSYDLAKVAAYYKQRSIDYSLMPDTKLANGDNIYTTQTTGGGGSGSGHSENGGGQTTLTVALNARVNVIDGTDFISTLTKIVLNGKGTGVLIINVATDNFAPGGIEVVDSDGNALKYGRVLFNFHAALNTLRLKGSSTPSVVSVLAPKAGVDIERGKWAGNYIGLLTIWADAEVQNVPFGSFVRPTVGWTNYYQQGCDAIQVNTFTPGVAVASKWLCAWGAW